MRWAALSRCQAVHAAPARSVATTIEVAVDGGGLSGAAVAAI